MENRIEQEINQTLQYMDKNPDIQVSSSFVEDVSGRIAGIQIPRDFGYRNRLFYPVAIVLLIALNLMIGFTFIIGRQSASVNSGSNQVSVLVGEYGIGQSLNI